MRATSAEAKGATTGEPTAGPGGDRWRALVTAGWVLAVVGGVALRFFTASHLWLDEALTAEIAGGPSGEIPEALRQDGHPPLYYLLLHAWIRVVGEGDAAIRALSGVLSVAALPLMWFAGRRLGGRSLAAIAVLVLATSPFVIRYATEARMYALVLLLVLAGQLLVARALDRPKPLVLVGVALVSGALLLTHYWAFWLVGAVLVLLVWQARRGHRWTPRSCWSVAGAVAAGGVLFLPWLPVFWDQLGSTGTPWAGPVRPTELVAISLADLGRAGVGTLREGELVGLAMAVLFLLGVFGRAGRDGRIELDLRTVPTVRPEAAVAVTTLVLGVTAGWLSGTTWASRYFSVVLALLVLVAAAGAMTIPRPVRDALVGLLAALSLGVAAHNATIERTQAPEIAAEIAAGAAPGDLVVTCPDQLAPALHRVLGEVVPIVTYPDLGSPERVDWRDYAARHAASDPAATAAEVLARAGEGDVWLVTNAGYEAVGDLCDELSGSLATARSAQVLVSQDAAAHFEHATLVRFRAP